MLDRRRFLSYIPKAAAFGALAGLVQTSASSAQADENKGVGAIEHLMRGHGMLLRAIIIYDVVGNRISKGHKTDPALIVKVAGVVHNYLERFHESMEEKYIFAPMEQKNICFASIQELKIQHGTGYQLTQNITKLAQAGKQSSDLSRYLSDFVSMYRYHAAWEDTIVFPAFDAMEQNKELAELADTIDQEEKKVLGHDGFGTFLNQIAEVEKERGISDLLTQRQSCDKKGGNVKQAKSQARQILLSLVVAFNCCQASQAEDTKSLLGNAPKRILSFTVGAVVGAPIAVVRSTRHQLVKQTKEAYSLGCLYPPFGWVTAGVFGIPSGLLCGAGYGLGDAVVDSFKNAKEAPFSKESFSLGELEW